MSRGREQGTGGGVTQDIDIDSSDNVGEINVTPNLPGVQCATFMFPKIEE